MTCTSCHSKDLYWSGWESGAVDQCWFFTCRDCRVEMHLCIEPSDRLDQIAPGAIDQPDPTAKPEDRSS